MSGDTEPSESAIARQARGGRLLAMTSASLVLACTGYFLFLAPSGPPPTELPPEVAESIGPERVERREARNTEGNNRFRVRLMPTLAGGLLALAAGWWGSAALLVVAFVVGFVPFAIGPYFLLVGGPATAIGLGELSYLAAAYSISTARRKAQARAPESPKPES